MATAPLVDPEIEDLRQQVLARSALIPAPCDLPPAHLLLLAALKNASPQPQLDEPLDARIC